MLAVHDGPVAELVAYLLDADVVETLRAYGGGYAVGACRSVSDGLDVQLVATTRSGRLIYLAVVDGPAEMALAARAVARRQCRAKGGVLQVWTRRRIRMALRGGEARRR
ncbi:hypothetical protein [Aureimonas jatrophae]|nr:hypothetical protein [Aureimonas jatrophae]MBB3952621.1 hypothetical protein [Aureimonas jatrophae]